MAHALIAGAGYSGRRIATLLRDRDWQVTVASRNPPVIPGTKPLVLDVDQSSSAASLGDRLAQPADVLIYLIPPDRTAPNAEDCDPRLQAVLEAVGNTVQRVVLASTTGVYGDHGGRKVTEATTTSPLTARAIARVGAERTLARFAAQQRVSYSILRIAGIYGPDRLMLDGIEQQRALLTLEDAGPGNRIHVDDLALAFALVASDAGCSEIINVADGNLLNSTAFALKVAELAGIEPPPLVSRETAQQTFSPMRLSFLNESRSIEPARLLALLGEQMRYRDPIDGIRASLETMGRLKAESASTSTI